MLVDAIRSELNRLLRNRATVFWGILFIPIVLAVGGTIVSWFVRDQSQQTLAAADGPPLPIEAAQPLNLAEGILGASGLAANGAVLVFSLIVAAALYAGDYRWETWRLISARNTRLNLILGKVLTFGIVVLVGIGLFHLATLLFGLSGAVIDQRPLTFEIGGEAVGHAAALGALSWLRIMQYAMLGLLTAVLTRSLLASLFIPVVVGFAQSLVGSLALPFLGWGATEWRALLMTPGAAYNILQMAITPEANPLLGALGGPGAPMPAAPPQADVVKAATSLTLWTAIPLAAALAWFHRQDLSKE